jgi:RNA polymerase sigma-70 factor (ECF subfamily)
MMGALFPHPRTDYPMSPDPSGAELELLARVGAGDAAAVGELFDRHRGYLRRIAAARFDDRLRPRVDESDLVQDALAAAARAMAAYLADRPLPLRLWLRQLLLDALLAARRRHLGADCRAAGREVGLSGGSYLDAARVLTAPDPSPGGAARVRERAGLVRDALAALGPDDRRVIELRTFEGLSTREAADLIGITPEAASKRLVRALERLRAELVARGVSGGSRP